MKKIIIIILLSSAVSSFAQDSSYEQLYNPFDIYDSTGLIDIPFTGGFNSPKPKLIDFDHDGLVDLFIGELSGKLVYYKNYGTPELPDWQPEIDWFGKIDIGTWYTFCDIDSDNDFDLFCDSRNGKVLFYQNESINDSVIFVLNDTSFGDFAAGNSNTPAFADLDNDNDFDFFYSNTSGYLDFYENIGDSVNYDFVLTSNSYDSVYAFPRTLKSNQELHGFSSIAFVDINDDGDLDLFWGDIFNTNMYLFQNNGTVEVSNLEWATQDYLPAITFGFNHPSFADLDNDGDLDMIIGVANSADIDNLLLYRNIGSSSLAVWQLETNNLISTFDLSSNSVPTFGDLDGDNDFDLLVGNISGNITYYENIGTNKFPSFQFVTSEFEAIDVKLSSIPYLFDFDNDNDLDLFVGTGYGRIEYWENVGDKNNFSFQQVTNQLAGIKRDQLATPRLADLNNDSIVDLIVGEWDFNSHANVLLYEGSYQGDSLIFTLTNPTLLNLDIIEFTIPHLYDWDKDGKVDILLGKRTLGFDWYRNISDSGSFPDSTTFILQSDTLPGYEAGRSIQAAFADLDFDGDDDILLGEENGGLTYFMKTGTCCIGIRGNIDNSQDQSVDVSDVIYLVDYMFLNPAGPEPECLIEADVDNSSYIEIADLLILVDYVFFVPPGPAPLSCP